MDGSHVLQQPPIDSGSPHLLHLLRELVLGQHQEKLPVRAPQQPHSRHDLLRFVIRLHIVYLCLVYSRHLVNHLLYGRSSQQTPTCPQWSDLLRRTRDVPECLRYRGGFCEWRHLYFGKDKADLKSKGWDITDLEPPDERKQPEHERWFQVLGQCFSGLSENETPTYFFRVLAYMEASEGVG